MGRKKKKSVGLPPAMWLVTFSDLVTLLLTFFVLLLSMASMNQSFLTRVSLFTADMGLLSNRGAGRVPQRIKLVTEILEKPLEALEKPNRIKDLLFPDDEMPPEIDRATLLENIEVLAHPEGVALALTDKLIFKSGSSELSPQARFVLERIGQVLAFMTAPVNIAGYSDNVGGGSDGNYELSAERAMTVMDFYLKQELDPRRLTVSAYGPNLPLAPGDSPEALARNRRVEILVKTAPMLGEYL